MEFEEGRTYVCMRNGKLHTFSVSEIGVDGSIWVVWDDDLDREDLNTQSELFEMMNAEWMI